MFPAWLARITILPAPVIVRVDPLIVPGPLTTWKVIGRPELVVE